MTLRRKIGWLALVFDLLIINGLVIYLLWPKTISAPLPVATNTDNSFNDCKNYVDEQIALIVLPTVAPTAKAQSLVTPKSAKNTTYITIPSAISTDNEWETVIGSDFYLSKNDHPGLVGVYMEGSIKLANSNGTGYVRLFDVTHGITPAGGELTTTSSTLTFMATGKIYLWEGYNHYQVQLKSTSSDTVTFSGGRLKIITEQ